MNRISRQFDDIHISTIAIKAKTKHHIIRISRHAEKYNVEEKK